MIPPVETAAPRLINLYNIHNYRAKAFDFIKSVDRYRSQGYNNIQIPVAGARSIWLNILGRTGRMLDEKNFSFSSW
jgi:hypothetical protein